MANEIPITIHGNLTKDLELQTFPDGTPYVNFTVANTPRRYDRQSQQWKDGEATFFNVKASGQLAANMARSLSKGARVIIEGVIAQRAFQGAGRPTAPHHGGHCDRHRRVPHVRHCEREPQQPAQLNFHF